MSYILFPGNHPDIALAEIQQAYKNISFLDLPEGVVFEKKLSKDEFESLGMFLKYGELLSRLKEETMIQNLFERIQKSLVPGKKLRIALNLYGVNRSFFYDLLKRMKREISGSFRVVNKDHFPVSSVVTEKQVLLKDGKDFMIVKDSEGNFLMAETLYVQNIESFEALDYQKPVRESQVGMTPPKLVRALFNMLDDANVVWDPFCGTGTFVLEGMRRGKKMIASDISPKMVEATLANAKWYAKEWGASGEYEVFCHDATKRKTFSCPVSVISEGDLGPLFASFPEEKDRIKTDEYLSQLYFQAFTSFFQAGISQVVLCLPVYALSSELGFMKKTLAEIKKTGYNLDTFCSSPLVYSRETQKVYRQICSFKSCSSVAQW